MNEISKLMLSVEELQLVTDSSFILTKLSIINKASQLLGTHAAFTQEYIKAFNLPEVIKKSSPKIAKGENYLKLPWLMLDYPRIFNKENIFAIRTMFWWGNFFSCTLHISGHYKKQYAATVIANLPALAQQRFYICISNDEWQHHFETTNYAPLHTMSETAAAKLILEKNFVKIACKFPLQQWPQMPVLLQQAFVTLMLLCKN